MTRHDRHELRSAILKAMLSGSGATTTEITKTLPFKVSSATVRKHLLAMEVEGYVRGGRLCWTFGPRMKLHVGSIYQTPERKLFEAAAKLVQSVLDRTSVDQLTLATATEVRDGLLRLTWLEDQGLPHGLTLEAAPAGATARFGETIPRYRIADEGEEALFKVGKA